MHRLVLALIVGLSCSSTSAAGGLPYGPTLSFAAYRNGEQIGRHTLTFERDGAQIKVSTSIDFTVKFMGFTAYRYSHRAQEVWAGNTLVSLASRTDDNGTKYSVQAVREDGALVVARNAEGRTVLPSQVLPSSHWNIQQVQQSVLLNTQKGTEARVRIAPVGRETVQTASGTIAATRYRYSGDVAMDQWFDDRGRWVKTSFTASDGSTIEYILQE